MSLSDLVRNGKVSTKDINKTIEYFRELLKIKQEKYKCRGFIPTIILDRVFEETFGEKFVLEMGGEE